MTTLFNTKTFETTKYDDEWVEIDERLIDIVVALNKKGYTTANSCEGHFAELAIADENGEHTASVDEMKASGFHPVMETPYMDFAPGVKISDAPFGWTLTEFDDRCTLYCENGWEGVYTEEVFRMKQSIVLDNLMEWAKKLP